MVSGSRGVTMNDLDIAKALFGEPQYEKDALKPGRTRNYTGTAVTSSENGYVTVRPDGDVVSAEDDGTIVIPTTGVVMQDNVVRITSINGSPVTDGSIGWGDKLDSEILNVKNYFWHDSAGAHVSTIENDATIGNNILIDANSIDIRDGDTLLASFDASEIKLGENSAFSSVSMCDDAVKVTANTTPLGDIYGQIMSLDGLELMTGDNSSTPRASVSLNNSPAWVQISVEDSGYSHQSVLMMEETNFSLSQTDGANTVIRHLGFPVDHGNISSQSGGAQAQFSTNGYCATLVLGNDTTPSGQWGSKTLCTIPAGYRPILTSYFPVAKTGVAQSMSYVMINASTGEVTLQNWGGTQSSVNYFCTCTWCY